MRFLTIILTILFTVQVLANVTIKVSPPNPVKEESFNVIFEVETTEQEDPMISFDPGGLEVLGKSREVSLSTSIVNGRFSSSRKVRINYEMISDRAKSTTIRDIKVDIGGKEIKHKPVRINILAQKKTPRQIFLLAEVSKTQAYIGEGIDVRYYLYSRAPVVQTEFKSFPKLNGFIKRYHKIADREEAVEYEGIVYRRSLKYSARVYPEKTGKVYVDPLRLNIQYASSSGNPFGSFGMAFNRFRSKGVSSPKVEVEVLPLPTEGVPLNFTGLVGEHEFRLSSSKQKFVVNEAIELKLEVTGPGALEKFEAPKIYKDNALEQFDTKSEFFEVGMDSGRKVFDYTYLARADVLIPERKLSIAYFDPNEKVYKEKFFMVPSLQIGGGGGRVSSPLSNTTSSGEMTRNQDPSPVTSIEEGVVAPLFRTEFKGIPLNWDRLLQIALVIVVFIQLIEFAIKKWLRGNQQETVTKEIQKLKKKGLEYASLIRLLYMLDKSEGTGSLKSIIERSGLSKADKEYFLDLLSQLGARDYNEKSGKRVKKPKFKVSAFKSLEREITNGNI